MDMKPGWENKDDCQERILQAVYDRDLDGVKVLVGTAGADLETRDYYGQTALSSATLQGYPEIVEFLVDHGADLETRDNNCQTPLLIAAINGRLEIIKILANLGANVETANARGRTALSWAVINGHIKVVEFLEEVIERRHRQAAVGNLTKSAAHR